MEELQKLLSQIFKTDSCQWFCCHTQEATLPSKILGLCDSIYEVMKVGQHVSYFRQLGSMEIPSLTEEIFPTVECPVSPTTTEIQNVSDHEEIQQLPPPRRIRKKRERSKVDIDEVFTSYPETKANRIPVEELDNPDLCFFKSLLSNVAK
ncbi:uncharacterized protein LOC111872907 [Cryptotermes secundus]|uniref:uncharacterized protein LOC111872907 n=1 Tax=Cryptotermes secundus TaxID=105785 RepID=UPI000CD7CB94|nr:uncharacterized protein LOC111872907 [Cryptotermes secundus]XP_023722953.1 uncharacterized protein LOC111872907 [Cryptotermes secundus]